MGVFLALNLSNTMTKKEWLPVYEKSLSMAKKFRFFDVGCRSIHGYERRCIFPTEEKKGDRIGWRVCGSFPSYHWAEPQFTSKNIGTDKKTDSPVDALIALIPNIKKCDDLDDPTHQIWGNKTQGEPHHMGLLAIGCMIENELGIQAVVDGDITYGQCVKAAEMASKMLGENINLPIRCRLNDLYDRVNKFNMLSNSEKINFLLHHYLGDKNAEVGTFISDHFSTFDIAKYWQERFRNVRIDTWRFEDIMKEYFCLGGGLKEFCEYADFDKTDTKLCETFIIQPLKRSMHIKDKDCFDVLDYTKSEKPYSVYSLMASFFLRGSSNPAIDRYISLDEIKSIMNEKFGDVINVNKIIDTFISQSNDEEKSHEALTQRIDELNESRKNDHEKYDICSYEELVYYTPDSQLAPKLEKGIYDSFEVFYSLGNDPECKAIMEKSTDDMFAFLVKYFRGDYLTEAQWNRIYDEIERDKTTFKRYYPMVRVTNNGDLPYLLRAFITDDDFWNQCCKRNVKE